MKASKFGFLGMTLLAFGACDEGKGPPPARDPQPVVTAELDGDWESDCHPARVGSDATVVRSELSVLRIAGGRLSAFQSGFSDEACHELVAFDVFDGAVSLGSQPLSGGLRAFDYVLVHTQVAPLTEGALEYYRSTYPDYTWTLGYPTRIVAARDVPTQTVGDGGVSCSVFKLDDGKLYFGKTPTEVSAPYTGPQGPECDRVLELDRGTPYTLRPPEMRQ